MKETANEASVDRVVRLSQTQRDVLELLSDGSYMTRNCFYLRGYRMTTVRSLVKKGLLRREQTDGETPKYRKST